MNKNDECGRIFIVGLILGLAIGLFVFWCQNNMWKAEAIHHGAAHYNTTNSFFEWNK